MQYANLQCDSRRPQDFQGDQQGGRQGLQRPHRHSVCWLSQVSLDFHRKSTDKLQNSIRAAGDALDSKVQEHGDKVSAEQHKQRAMH